MIFTKNNWFKFGYKYAEPFAWQTSEDDVYEVRFGRYTGQKLSFREALIENAKSTVDSFPGEKLEIMFSGGVDSELLIRAYQEIGHPVNVNIFKYENDYNAYDVNCALGVCKQLQVKPTIIDFNITRFFENDALDLMELIQSGHPRAMPQVTFMNYVDGIPLYGSGDPRFYRPHDDYSKKTEWMVWEAEYDAAWFRYAELKKRKTVMQWFKWEPCVIASMTRLKWFSELTGDQLYGKLGPNSTKLLGYREAYPDLILREKKTGFENTDHLVVPVLDAHRAKYGERFRQGAEQTVTEFLEEIWGTSENYV